MGLTPMLTILAIRIPKTRKGAIKRHVILQYNPGRLPIMYSMSSSNLKTTTTATENSHNKKKQTDKQRWEHLVSTILGVAANPSYQLNKVQNAIVSQKGFSFLFHCSEEKQIAPAGEMLQ